MLTAIQQDKLDRFLLRMDTVNWFRMVVCIMPGMILFKMALQFEWPLALRVFSVVTLFSGMLSYALWSFIRRKLHARIYGEETQEEPDSQTQYVTTGLQVASVHLTMLYQLRHKRGLSSDDLLDLLSTEARTNPDLALGDLIENALYPTK